MRYVTLSNTKTSELSVCMECGAILYSAVRAHHDALHVGTLSNPSPPSLSACIRLSRPYRRSPNPGWFAARSAARS